MVELARTPKVELPFLIPPWAHQRTALERAALQRDFALFFEMGAGKTSTAINILRWRCVAARRVIKTLVFCPPIVIENWRREFLAHSKLESHVVLLVGTGKARAQLFAKRTADGASGIFITNYESLLMEELMEAITAWKPEMLIFDESHKLKNLSAKRTKLAVKLSDLARHRLILSGSPILNSPMDLFSQFRVLDGGDTFGKSFFGFRAQFFDDKNAGMPKAKYFPNWVLRQGALETLNGMIKPRSMVVKKSECLDLPPLVRQTIGVALSKEQAKFYESMKKDFIAYLGDKACVATLAITKALRLQQIVSGFVTLEGENGEERTDVSLKDNPRAAALGELLAEITPSAKVIVWAVFRENYRAIRAVCKDLKLELAEVHGEVTTAQRQAEVDRFTNDPSCRVFLGHPQSAGIGLNLVSASYSIFYSRNFSLENDLQAEARNYRGGSEVHEKITRIDLIAPGTIDEQVFTALANKMEVGETVLRDIAGRI